MEEISGGAGGAQSGSLFQARQMCNVCPSADLYGFVMDVADPQLGEFLVKTKPQKQILQVNPPEKQIKTMWAQIQ